MIDKIKAIAENLPTIIGIQKQLKIIEDILIAKYGSYESAQIELFKIKEESRDEYEFQEKLRQLLNIDGLEKIMDAFNGSNSIIKVIDILHKINTGTSTLAISEQDISFLSDTIHAYESGRLKNSLPVNELFNCEVANKIKFTLKEIRDELNINQRTFNKWLNLKFGKKYNGRKKVNLYEYTEIYEMLLLGPGEPGFNFDNMLEEYQKRITDGLVFTKERLAKITDSDYKTLAGNVKFIDSYKSIDKYPYSIAQAIINHMG